MNNQEKIRIESEYFKIRKEVRSLQGIYAQADLEKQALYQRMKDLEAKFPELVNMPG